MGRARGGGDSSKSVTLWEGSSDQPPTVDAGGEHRWLVLTVKDMSSGSTDPVTRPVEWGADYSTTLAVYPRMNGTTGGYSISFDGTRATVRGEVPAYVVQKIQVADWE